MSGAQDTGELLPDVQGACAAQHAYRWTGEFADRELEAGYLDASWSETYSRVNALQVAAYVFVSWFIFDFVGMGFSWPFAVLTLARFTALCAILLALKFFHTPDRRTGFMICAIIAQAIVCLVVPVSLMLAGVDFAASLLAVVVILFAFYVGVPTRLPVNLALSVVLSLGFVLVTPALTTVSFVTQLEIGVLFVVVNAIGVEMVRAANRLRRRGFQTLIDQQTLYDRLKREVETRQEAEQTVRATEESFQSIFYAAPLPIALVDPGSFRVIQTNIAALALFGLTEDDAADFDVRGIFSDLDTSARIGRLVASGRAARPIEFPLRRVDGTAIWALVSGASIQFRGRPALLIGIQDVTARHEEAEALREAYDQATAASRSKSEFLANMSHELRTPLNAIIGFSEALERELFGPVGNPRYREYAEDIHDSGVHLLSLINDILDLSKIESGHFKLHEDEIELDHVVASATRIVRHRAQQASVAIECDLPAPPVMLMVDERALKQILINLVSNAVKFSPEGSKVRISAMVTPDGMCITVEDNGIGIAPDDIPRALTPFTQIDGSLSRTHEGTGLGLPLAKHLTELHGGTLSIESVVDQGTSVYVDLPTSCITGGIDLNTSAAL